MQDASISFGRPCLRRMAVEFICALTAVFLLLGPCLANILRGRNVLWWLWQPGDAIELLGFMCVLAAIGVAMRELIRWWKRPLWLRVFDHLFAIVVGAGLLAILRFHTDRPHGYRLDQYGMEMKTAWLVMFGWVGYSLASGRSTLVLRTRQLTQILSPGIIIVAAQLLWLPTLAQPMDSLVPASSSIQKRVQPVRLDDSRRHGDRCVYLLIFDEWSYTRTYDHGKLRPEFTNLAALSRQATTFHDAHSPGTDTAASIPGICRATPHVPKISDLNAGFMSDDRWIPARQYPSIITAAGCSDYRKIMVQWGYALSLWMRGELDVTRAYPCYPHAQDPIDLALLRLYNAAFYWTDPWSELAYEKLQTRVNHADRIRLYARMHHDLMSVLRDQPARTFAIVHYPLPHYPYILEADGSPRAANADDWAKNSVEGYRRNLACVDRIVGEIVDTLKSTGQYDDCMLVLTSDHSWRNDPAVPDRTDEILTHVPLIMKYPGQQEASRVDGEFRTYRLGSLIGQGLRNETKPSRLAAKFTSPDCRSVAAIGGQTPGAPATPTMSR